MSVVIPAYRRPDLLERALESAIGQDLDPARFEIIVVDSSPDDENAALVERLRARDPGVEIRLLRKAPEGPGPSRWLGARRARGRIVAFLDSDCQATAGWLRAGLAAFEDGIGIVQGRTTPRPDQPLRVFSRYVVIEAESPGYEGANIFFRRCCFDAVEKVPRDMTPRAERPSGGEDAMLAWQVKRAGWGSRFCSEALVHHEVIPVPVWFWLADKRLLMLPGLVREVPEFRAAFYRGIFVERAHAWLLAMLLGAALAPLSPWSLLAAAPYLAVRASEPTRTLRGPLRVLRAVVYLPRDLLSLGLLVVGSLRHRALVL